MIILIHVIFAITSIITASFTFFNPTIKKLIASYGLIVGTVGTGTYLLVTVPSHLLESCIMGIAYLTVIAFATVAAHTRMHARKLAAQEN